MDKPILAIVTQAIRNDIHAPLKHFKNFRVVHFYNEAPYGDMEEGDIKNGVEAVPFDSSSELKKLLLALNPDIIQGAEPYASRKALKFSLAAQSVAKKIGAKFVFPMLENRPASSRFGLASPVVKQILRRYAKRADLIFTLNQGARQNLEEVGITGNKIVNMMWGVWGIDTQLFSPRKNGSEPKWEGPTIIYVGRLVPEKGIADILEACQKLSELTSIKLVIVGKGPLEDMVKNARNDKNKKYKLEYFGAKLQKDLPPLFRAATVSVYPSITTPRWEEQIGTVNLQAMSCGTPVVSTRSGAIPEYVEDGVVGYLVPESNARELARALQKITQNKKLQLEFGKNGRKIAEEKYDYRKNIEEGEKWLGKLIKK